MPKQAELTIVDGVLVILPKGEIILIVAFFARFPTTNTMYIPQLVVVLKFFIFVKGQIINFLSNSTIGLCLKINAYIHNFSIFYHVFFTEIRFKARQNKYI